MPRSRAAFLALAIGASAHGCRASEAPVELPGASAERGRQALAAMGCAACHTIGGVRGANGKVGPPLDGVGERTMLAGQVPNTPANMIRWIQNPQAIEPGTAMPNLGVSEPTARDMAAYLYTLK